ncbi:nicotinate-nucleotide adenylyltransferase [Roseovarius sp.]|uniref:nicotinate-nucleotide adenylyltransferase n=1 Tax=Roseovarius sp. TaxID=1486281 RepID=UPI0026339649|nr:nicotinate-nucleotide adenylyltransferase [Roseovarius sp.]MDM8168153.1 nicotinate-nucleotide adenylyltransferase [Roseovarius sp.]
MRYALPHTRAGQAIGLLGGSFDPPHAGHVHISREALRRFGLDQVWWLVSPGNPLKERGPAPLEERMAACRAILDHPRMHVSDFEAQAGTRFTAETLCVLQAARPELRYVWLMGADNLAQLDQWQDWEDIVGRVPLGVLARPGQRISARVSKAARVYRFARLKGAQSRCLARADAPAWCFVNVPMRGISSTELRKAGDWRRSGNN